MESHSLVDVAEVALSVAVAEAAAAVVGAAVAVAVVDFVLQERNRPRCLPPVLLGWAEGKKKFESN